MAIYRCPSCRNRTSDYFRVCETCAAPLDPAVADWISGRPTPSGERIDSAEAGVDERESIAPDTQKRRPRIFLALLALAGIVVMSQAVGRELGTMLATEGESPATSAVLQSSYRSSDLAPFIERLPPEHRNAVELFYSENEGLLPRELQNMEAALTAAGLRRMSDRILVERAGLIDSALGRMSVPDCSHFFADQDPIRLGSLVVTTLTGDEKERYWAIATVAFAAEVLNRIPPSVLADHEVNAALDALVGEMRGSDATKFLSFLSSPPTNDFDRCWVARTLYDGASRPTPHGPKIARLLIE